MISLGIILLLSYQAAAYVYCPQRGDTQVAYKIPKHSCACNAVTAGSLRYHGNRIQFCNGKDYVNLVLEEKSLGSRDRPARNCKEIYDSDRNSRSGEYYLKSTAGRPFKAYCLMDKICGSRGWAMIMKINGRKQTFHYNSGYWSNKATFNVGAAKGGLDGQETKQETYYNLPIKSLCLGLKTGQSLRWITLTARASSLYSLIADGRYRATRLGRNKWKSLVPNSSLQRNCNREGFNTKNKHHSMARIGIISNQERDCNSPDSRIGFGTGGDYCGQNKNNSAGNEARCSADNGNKSIFSFGYILAQ